ncbi:Response regulator receiver domain-containing protein [Acetitomaculum ruminis DSM 5522]|uniref:Circadian input-output histidine kinase CikA n=1 Tax=Acetitomaculum ruminis DSM 5522 TaxID=1120918 RepID=A0A1I0YSR5_9FIRM|nr:response regulator [Acetitomaculum ruminis]SFB16425.1 Response regulator receiver domain-containing protein [Acetitomaculum ruminis DSM 5522]
MKEYVYENESYIISEEASFKAMASMGIYALVYYPQKKLALIPDTSKVVFNCDTFMADMPESFAGEFIKPHFIHEFSNMLNKIENGFEKAETKVCLKNRHQFSKMTVTAVSFDEKGLCTKALILVEEIFKDLSLSDEERKIQKQMHDRERLIDIMSKIYYATYYVDLTNNTYEELSSIPFIHNIIGEKGIYTKRIKSIAGKVVSPEFTKKIREFLDLSTIDERLKGEKSVMEDFYGNILGWSQIYVIEVDRDKNGNLKTFIVAIRDINQEKEKQEQLEINLKLLSAAASTVYPLGIFLNLTKNTYQVLSHDKYIIHAAPTKGTIDELVEMGAATIFNEKHKKEFLRYFSRKAMLSEFLAGGNGRVLRHTQMGDDENIHWVETRSIYIDNTGGDIYAVTLSRVIDDEIEEEKRREDTREIIEGLGEEYYSVLLVDYENNKVMSYRSSNEDGELVASYIRKNNGLWDKTVAQFCKEIVEAGDREEFMEALSLENLKSDDNTFDIIYTKKGKGEITYIQCHIVYVERNSGRKVAVIGSRDVGEMIKKEKLQEKALVDAFSSAEAANRAKSNFLANMSHDIRTPMNAIIGMTAIAKTNLDNKEKLCDCLSKITIASDHLLGLINEVLDMSKIESGKVDLAEEEFNLSELFDNLLNMNKTLILKKNQELIVTVSNVEHEEVLGDSLRIQQVFTNILGNAIKYTPEKGSIHICLSEKPTNKEKLACYEFIVEDNGIGMSKEYVEKIFDAFSRAEDKRVRRIQGTGLGMAITRNIVRMMGGDIKVESKLNKGSKFTITFYLNIKQENKAEYRIFEGKKILVVGDNPVNVEVVSNYLENIGFITKNVYSGFEAIEEAVDGDYLAVMINASLWDMSGYDISKEIKKYSKDIYTVVADYNWAYTKDEYDESKADAFISKPLFKSNIIRVFDSLINKNKIEKKEEEPLFDFKEMDLSDYRVLLVEDNELNAEIAREILSLSKIRVDWVEDGSLAVEKLTECEDGYYDIVLMDIQMPGMNGYEATRTVRKSERDYCKNVPIIAMTANAFAQDVQEAIESGMNEHISKPIDMPTLARVLQKWVIK